MTRIYAQVKNAHGSHQATVQTNQRSQSLAIPPKAEGFGSSVNGGELLFLALATCYCNDLYREAAKQGISVQAVEVTVEGDFEGDGLPAKNIGYYVKVAADASQEAVMALMKHTDQVAEIQNTLRSATGVALLSSEVISQPPSG